MSLADTITTTVTAIFTERSLGYLSSVSLLFGLCTGPGITLLPGLYQHGGFFLPSLTLVTVGLLAFSSSWMTVYSQSRLSLITRKRLDYLTVCKELFHGLAYRIVAFMFLLALILMALGGVLQATQSLDCLIANTVGYSCALRLSPPPWEFVCSNEPTSMTPFAEGRTVVSLGGVLYLVCVIIPFSLVSVDFPHPILTLILTSSILVLCVSVGISRFDADRIPLVTATWKFPSLVGVALFNYTLVFAVPSWNNQRLLTAGAKRSLALAISLSCVVMIGAGYVLGGSLAEMSGNSNLIDAVSRTGHRAAVACVTVMSLVDNISAAPIIGAMLKYSLMKNFRFFKRHRYFVTFVPWLAAIPLYNGGGLELVVEYGGLVFTGLTCFVLPPVIFCMTLKYEAEREAEQEELIANSDVLSVLSEQAMIRDQFPSFACERWRWRAYSLACMQLAFVSASLSLSVSSTLYDL